MHMVAPGEMTVADDGYKDRNFFIYPTANPESAARQKEIMARHETLNKRLKSFNVLNFPYRHDISTHHECFHAVINVTNVTLTVGMEPLYEV